MMKLRPQTIFCATVLGILACTGISSLSKQVTAQTPNNAQVQWICNQSYDAQTNEYLPTTFAWTDRGKIAIIRWATQDFTTAGYDPQTRCDEVSPRFQQAYENKTLGLITNGWMNNQRVICTANEPGGTCVDLLVTLRPEDDSLAIVNHLKEIFNGRNVGPLKHSGGEPQVYFQMDLDYFLDTAPVE